MTQSSDNGSKKKDSTQPLARVGDPLPAPDGSFIAEEDDDDLEAVDDLPPPSTAVPFKEYRPIARRVISDLRASPQSTNVALVVLGYTLLGISDGEIASSTGLAPHEVNLVRESRIYSEAFENIMRELISANSEYIECRIAAHSSMALDNIAGIARKSKNTGYRLTASRDLLDRAGHRPQDNASRQNQGMNELHIVITSPKDQIERDLDLTITANPRSKKNGNGSR